MLLSHMGGILIYSGLVNCPWMHHQSCPPAIQSPNPPICVPLLAKSHPSHGAAILKEKNCVCLYFIYPSKKVTL